MSQTAYEGVHRAFSAGCASAGWNGVGYGTGKTNRRCPREAAHRSISGLGFGISRLRNSGDIAQQRFSLLDPAGLHPVQHYRFLVMLVPVPLVQYLDAA